MGGSTAIALTLVFLTVSPAAAAQALHPSSGTSTQNLPFLAHGSLADDPHDGVVLAFGGQDAGGDPTSWTYTFHAGSWTNDSSGVLPTPRWGAAMAYDPVDGVVVLFGGCPDSQCYPALGDTWTYANGMWSDLTPSLPHSPPARGMTSMAWDPTGQQLLLFSGWVGSGGAGTYWNDTWVFAHDRWTNLTGNLSGPAPPLAFETALATNPSGGVLAFGGGGPIGAQTWTFENRSWTNLTAQAGNGPSARRGAMVTDDLGTGYDLLFGGRANGSYLGDAWSYQGGHWTALHFSNGPPATAWAGMTYDSGDQEVVMFGGMFSSGITNAVWVLQNGGWTIENPYSNNTLGIFLFVFSLMAVVLIVAVFAGNRTRLRNDRKLRELFPIDPRTRVDWIPTSSSASQLRAGIVAGAVSSVILLPFSFLIALTLTGTGAGATWGAFILYALLIFLVMAIFPIATVRTRLRFATQSIGTSNSGVIVQRKAGAILIPWSYLVAPTAVGRKGQVIFQYYYADGGMRGTFLTDAVQARAILSQPAAAGWTIPEPILRALGAGAGMPPSPPVPMGMPPGTPPSTPTGTVRPPSQRLPYVGPRYGTVPPPPAGWTPGPPSNVRYGPPSPTSTARSVPPRAPITSRSPQLRRCASCGALQGISAVYCSRCGQPVG